MTLADYLLTIEPAAVLGKMGGKATAKRGRDYFRKIAGMRKTKGGRQAAPSIRMKIRDNDQF